VPRLRDAPRRNHENLESLSRASGAETYKWRAQRERRAGEAAGQLHGREISANCANVIGARGVISRGETIDLTTCPITILATPGKLDHTSPWNRQRAPGHIEVVLEQAMTAKRGGPRCLRTINRRDLWRKPSRLRFRLVKY